MKETGVTRKLDELGRIVIPKEIRTNFRIEEGDFIEFYLNDNEIVIKKPSPLKGLDDEIYKLFQIYNLKFYNSIAIIDNNSIILGYGKDSDKIKNSLSSLNLNMYDSKTLMRYKHEQDNFIIATIISIYTISPATYIFTKLTICSFIQSINGCSAVNIIFMMFGLSTISYDAFDNGEAFLFTLPITKKLYVQEKYVFSLGALLCGFLLSLVLLLTIKGAGASEISFATGYMLGGTLFLSIMLPIELKFGPEKARLAMIAAMIIIASSVYAIVGVAKKLNMDEYFGELAHIGVPSILTFLGLVSALIIFISYKFSCRIMEKKEF